MDNLTRIYSSGKVGMVVVLDHVHLSSDSPFAGYKQPAFFTIVEDRTPETRFQGVYLLRDSAGNLIPSQEGSDTDKCSGSISSYLIEVTEWLRWRDENTTKAIATRDAAIRDLKAKLSVLKEVMENQGVRVVTQEQAKVLGIAK